jgi:hypothetical protein
MSVKKGARASYVGIYWFLSISTAMSWRSLQWTHFVRSCSPSLSHQLYHPRILSARILIQYKTPSTSYLISRTLKHTTHSLHQQQHSSKAVSCGKTLLLPSTSLLWNFDGPSSRTLYISEQQLTVSVNHGQQCPIIGRAIAQAVFFFFFLVAGFPPLRSGVRNRT